MGEFTDYRLGDWMSLGSQITDYEIGWEGFTDYRLRDWLGRVLDDLFGD